MGTMRAMILKTGNFIENSYNILYTLYMDKDIILSILVLSKGGTYDE